jgi:hypothetical protein
VNPVLAQFDEETLDQVAQLQQKHQQERDSFAKAFLQSFTEDHVDEDQQDGLIAQKMKIGARLRKTQRLERTVLSEERAIARRQIELETLVETLQAVRPPSAPTRSVRPEPAPRSPKIDIIDLSPKKDRRPRKRYQPGDTQDAFVQTEPWDEDRVSLVLGCDTVVYDAWQRAERGVVDLKSVEQERKPPARVAEGGRDGSPEAGFATQTDPVAGLPDLREFQVVEEALLRGQYRWMNVG